MMEETMSHMELVMQKLAEVSDPDLHEALLELAKGIAGLKARNARLEAELKKHRWIPVTERLPERGQEVLTFDKSCGIDRGYYSEDIFWVLEHTADPEYWKPITPPEQASPEVTDSFQITVGSP